MTLLSKKRREGSSYIQQITHHEPYNEDNSNYYYQPDGIDPAIEFGAISTVYVDPGEESYDRYRQKSQGIRSECARQISVEKGVKHTLAAATDTLQPCDPMEKALGHEAGSKRVGKIIKYGSGHKHRGHNPSQP